MAADFASLSEHCAVVSGTERVLGLCTIQILRESCHQALRAIVLALCLYLVDFLRVCFLHKSSIARTAWINIEADDKRNQGLGTKKNFCLNIFLMESSFGDFGIECEAYVYLFCCMFILIDTQKSDICLCYNLATYFAH